MWRAIVILTLSMVGCIQLPPTAGDIQSKKFESVPDQAVIYIARPRMDSRNGGTIVIGNNSLITTFPGTYYRWETAPGTQRIQGYGPYSASVTVQAEAGKIYYVLHKVEGGIRSGIQSMHLQQVDERYGRKLVTDAQLL